MFGKKKPTIADFGDVLEPSEALEPILGKDVRGALTEWLGEIFAAEALLAVGVKPRRRAIFDGPPGVGKTTLAHHLAARLGLTMLAVRPERLIDKYVGSTGRNMGDLFDTVLEEQAERQQPIVLFLDEFDAISGQRRQAQQGADDERNNYVNTLLQRLEQHDGFVIAATNYASHIDQAIWRRFDIHITLELPGQGERKAIVERYLAPFGLPESALREFSHALETASPALIRALCENIKRQIVLSPILDMPADKASVFGRVLASCHPHKDAGKPRLWSLGTADKSLERFPWPLPMAADVIVEQEGPPIGDIPSDNLIPFNRPRPGASDAH